jgi:hypothetical protein
MKTTGFRFLAAIFTLALTSGVVAATGCGGASVSSLCEDICACQRCTTNDLKTCQDQGSAAADAADAAGCSSQFSDAVSCSSAHVSCKSGQAAADGCDAEFTALSKCSSTLSVFGGNACQLAANQVTAQLAACPKPPTVTSTSSGGTQAECTDAAGRIALCQAAAIGATSCNCLGAGDSTLCTQDELTAFSNAISLCN